VRRKAQRPLALAAIAVGAAESALLFLMARGVFSSAELFVALIAGWSFIGSGLVVWARRPENRTGPLMVLVGISFFAGMLGKTEQPTLVAIGDWVWPIYLAVFVHLLLAFPSGMLESRFVRTIAIAAYLDLGVLDNAPLVLWDAEIADALYRLSFGVGAIVFVLSGGVLGRRWLSGSRAWRRAVAPVLWPGAFTLGTITVFYASAYLEPTLHSGDVGPIPRWAFYVSFTAIPFAFLAVLLRSRLARGSVAELVVELDESGVAGGLRDALARALGDPSLSVAYWLPEERRYVDIEGRPVEIAGGAGRAVTLVEREGRRVASLVHDEALSAEPDLIRAASAAAALALDNERLQAELRARLDELKASRARIVTAGDRERKRIERNLHDGTQQRLTSIALGIGLAESKLRSDPAAAAASLRQTKEALAVTLAELRDLSQGIHPANLTERGLGPALEDLAYSAPIPIAVAADLNGRLPEQVEAGAYYVVAEALANVAKHARASSAKVAVTRDGGWLQLSVIDDGIGGADPNLGTGLRGLADRVHTLGGTLAVESPPVGGTEIRATIPCG
jgi:signal transduction histidine kinase